jgi:hypothetical protein
VVERVGLVMGDEFGEENAKRITRTRKAGQRTSDV